MHAGQKEDISNELMTDIESLKNTIILQGLGGEEPELIFESICQFMSSEFNLYRISMGMPTLHPLVEATSFSWTSDTGLEVLHSEHGYSEKEDWLASPIAYMFDHELDQLNFRLDQGSEWQRFPLLKELAQKGCVEYLAKMISFNENPTVSLDDSTDGMLTSWATTHPDGFPEAFFQTLSELLPTIGIVSKLSDRENALTNILEAYLGQDAGIRVANGQIERGELVSIDAVIWYSDMRNSTYLADKLSSQAFLDTLNVYFECTAGSILENEGQVLRFIGDAVLSIFPVESFGTAKNAAQAAWNAALMARKKINELNPKRKLINQDELDFGLGLHAGTLKYGNIGIPTRLEFSVIGPVANEVARLESLTKELNRSVIVSESFSKLLPLDWECLGTPNLKGVNKEFIVYSISN